MDLGGDRAAAEGPAAQSSRGALLAAGVGAGSLQRFALVALEVDVVEGLAERHRCQDGDAGRIVGAGDRHAQGEMGVGQVSADVGDEA